MSDNVERGFNTQVMLFIVPVMFVFIAFVSEILLVYYSAGLIEYELKRSLTIGVTESLLDEYQKDRFSTSEMDEAFRSSIDVFIEEKYLSGNAYELNNLDIKKANDHLYTVEGSFERPSFFFYEYLGDFRWHVPFSVRCRIQRLD